MSKIQSGGRIITDGLKIYLDAANPLSYSGSGTLWEDLSGNKNNGSLTNGPTFTNDYKGGIILDGTNDLIDCGVVDITSGTDISIEIVLSIDGIQVPYADIIDYNHGSGGWVIQQYFGSFDDSFYFAWFNGTSYEFVYFTLPIDNSIFYLTIVKSGTNFYVYKNGLSLSTGSGSSTITSTGLNMIIGDYVSGGRNLKGTIYTTKIYNRDLSSDEVYKNFISNKSRFGL